MGLVTCLAIVAAVAGFGAATALYFAGIGVPHDQQTWNGKAPHELAHRRRQHILRNVGFALAALGMLAAISIALLQ